MITRTVVVTKCECVCVDVTTVETLIKEYSLSGSYPNNEQVLKELKKAYETDTFKVVAIQSLKEEEKMYGLSELEFIKLAKELNPETRKVI